MALSPFVLHASKPPIRPRASQIAVRSAARHACAACVRGMVALETPVAPCGSANHACVALVDHRHWIRPQTLDTDGYNADRRVNRGYACLTQQCPDTRILWVESRDYLDTWILDTEQTLPDTDRHAQTLLDTTDTAWIRIPFQGVFPEC